MKKDCDFYWTIWTEINGKGDMRYYWSISIRNSSLQITDNSKGEI